MNASRTVRLAVAGVLGLGAGGALWSRAAQIEPFLEFKTERLARTDEFEFWQVTFRVRGGETIDEVRLDPGSGNVKLPEPDARAVRGLKAGWSSGFRMQLNDPRGAKGSVRIVQGGRVPRTYDVALEEKQ